MAEEPRGFAAGGIALVAVDLDDRAGVELGPVIAVMLVGVVGVNRVRVVRRYQQRAIDAALERLALGQYAAQHLFEERPVGATHGHRADFFMIGADQYAGFLRAGPQQGLQSGVARQQIVQARAGDKVPVQADDRRTLGVVEAQLEVQNHIGHQPVFAAELVGEQGTEVWPVFAGNLCEDRRQLVLWVDCPALIGLPVQVDG